MPKNNNSVTLAARTLAELAGLSHEAAVNRIRDGKLNATRIRTLYRNAGNGKYTVSVVVPGLLPHDCYQALVGALADDPYSASDRTDGRRLIVPLQVGLPWAPANSTYGIDDAGDDWLAHEIYPDTDISFVHVDEQMLTSTRTAIPTGPLQVLLPNTSAVTVAKRIAEVGRDGWRIDDSDYFDRLVHPGLSEQLWRFLAELVNHETGVLTAAAASSSPAPLDELAWPADTARTMVERGYTSDDESLLIWSASDSGLLIDIAHAIRTGIHDDTFDTVTTTSADGRQAMLAEIDRLVDTYGQLVRARTLLHTPQWAYQGQVDYVPPTVFPTAKPANA